MFGVSVTTDHFYNLTIFIDCHGDAANYWTASMHNLNSEHSCSFSTRPDEDELGDRFK